MVLQGEATEDEEDVAAPLGEIGGLKVQSDRNEISDILDGGGLAEWLWRRATAATSEVREWVSSS
jgi:hypothetical protein